MGQFEGQGEQGHMLGEVQRNALPVTPLTQLDPTLND